jgi:hypothetical protein
LPSSGNNRNFPRRCGTSKTRLVNLSASPFGNGQRKSGRPTKARTTRLPDRAGTNASLTVSTSGNSGIFLPFLNLVKEDSQFA